MNRYLFSERLEFYFKAQGNNSNDAFAYHADAIGKLIDYARTIGLEVNECMADECICWRQEEDGSETEVSGWKDDSEDEKKVENKS